MATTPKILTYEEWLRLPVTEDAVEEVVNGEIRVMPPNDTTHADIVDELTHQFNTQVDRKTTRVYGSVHGLVIRRQPLSCRVPDISVFFKREMEVRDGLLHSAPGLVIEVLSPSNTRREINEKLTDYQSIGVPEVWLVSPEARTVEVLLLEEGALRTKDIYNAGTITPSRFANVKINVESIWPE